jgi:hypothetical protein
MVRTAVLHLLPGGILSASAPPVTREHWEPATWPSGDYHDRTCTGKLSVPFRAHQRSVRRRPLIYATW